MTVVVMMKMTTMIVPGQSAMPIKQHTFTIVLSHLEHPSSFCFHHHHHHSYISTLRQQLAFFVDHVVMLKMFMDTKTYEM